MLAQPNKRPFVKNAILANLSLSNLAAIGPFLEPIALRERTILHEARKSVENVYFVESGIVSQRIIAAGSILETAVMGCRSAVGASSLFGGHIPTHQSVVLVPGHALRIQVEDLRRVMSERDQVREHLSRYVQALVMHGAQMGLCGVRHNLEQRLACWLCLACDALEGNVLPVTHDYLSCVLGLRRAGVTETLIRFQDQGLLRKMRGVLQVDDHKRLAQKACSCYSIVTTAYTSVEHYACVKHQAETAV